MSLNALLLSHDPVLLSALRRGLDEFSARIELCGNAAVAVEMLPKRKFELIVIDCDDVDGGSSVLRGMRKHPSNRNSIVLAMVHEHTTAREAMEMGANFTLEKPLSHDRLMRCLRAAYPLVVREQRRCYRHTVEQSVMINVGSGPELRLRMLNLSEGGMLVQVQAQHQKEFATGKQVRFRFQLPDTATWMEGKAQVMWVRNEDRAGLQFSTIPQGQRLELVHWVSNRIMQDSPVPLTLAPQPPAPATRPANQSTPARAVGGDRTMFAIA